MTISKPCVYKGQSLIQHTEGVLSYVERALKSGYHETVQRRLKAVGIDAASEEIAWHIRVAGVLHDVGKAIEAYQARYSDNCVPLKERRAGFYLHEVFSAVYLKRIFDRLGEKSDMIYLTLLAVLDHLHAMGRNLRNFKEAFTFDKTHLGGKHREIQNDINNLIKTGGYISDKYIPNMANYISSRLGLNVELLSDTLAENISYAEIVELTEKISKVEEDSTRRRKLKGYVLILLPIVIGDNLDAYENRPSDESTSSRAHFIEELKSALGGESWCPP
ncbi:MAG: CRISPR-associated endonuclease Cas3'' [Nitrososphaerota archaeon]|nr:CRISPR-associated endonuclease Cas3'' [Nitrososphaerota archaeon]